MLRSIPKLLTALLVLGCGSGAMASPSSPSSPTSQSHGQWMDDNTGSGDSAPNQAPAGQSQAPAVGSPSQSPYSSEGSSHGGYHGQNQNPSQNSDQDEDDSGAAQSSETDQVRLGVMVMPLTPELRQHFGAGDRGVLVARVEPSSAASRAGLQAGDVLVRVGGRQVRSADDVVQALAARQGGRLRIAVMRDGRPLQLFATLPGSQSQDRDQDQAGNQL